MINGVFSGGGDGMGEAGCGFLAGREVEAWIDGTLNPQRVASFSTHQTTGCGSCSLLAADLETFREVSLRGPLVSEVREFDASRAIVRAHLRQQVEALAPRRRGFRFSWTWATSVAAAAMLMLALFLPRMMGPDATGTIALADGVSYEIPVMPFSAPETVRGGATASELWAEAGAAFATERYADAASAIARIESRGDASADTALYLGEALVLAARYDEAVPVLERALSVAREQGLSEGGPSFYLGVAHLGRDDRAAAAEALEIARSAGGYFGGEAESLLGQLASGASGFTSSGRTGAARLTARAAFSFRGDPDRQTCGLGV